MSDVDEMLEEVRRLGERPPAAPSPLENIAGRAAQRRRRRRAGIGSAATAVVLAVALLGGQLGGSEGRLVETADVPTTVTSTASSTLPAEDEQGLVVEPSVALVDGQVVNVSGPFSIDAVINGGGIAVCDAGGMDQPEARSWCDINLVRTASESSIELTVVRRIQTAHGIVDCAERPGRCVVGVLTAGGTSYTAPISFRDDLGALPTPAIELDASDVDNGDRVVVRLSGFAPVGDLLDRDDEIWLTQCIGTASEPWSQVDVGWDRCDMARSTRATVDQFGTATAALIAGSEILTYEGWVPCDPCVVLASAWRQPTVVASVDVADVGPPVRPVLRIVPAGPYVPGQRVRLEGTGFGPGDPSVQIGWCAFRTDEPETEIQGDTSYGYTACGYPVEGLEVTADGEGNVVVDDFPLPNAEVRGIDCRDPGHRCGLAWHPGEGTLPAFVTLFDLGG